MSASVVTARSLSKWYGQVIALNDVTVDVPTGVVGLLGPNGAGKSTFMKLVTGQLRPSQGAVEVFGEPIWLVCESVARFGAIQQREQLALGWCVGIVCCPSEVTTDRLEVGILVTAQLGVERGYIGEHRCSEKSRW